MSSSPRFAVKSLSHAELLRAANVGGNQQGATSQGAPSTTNSSMKRSTSNARAIAAVPSAQQQQRVSPEFSGQEQQRIDQQYDDMIAPLATRNMTTPASSPKVRKTIIVKEGSPQLRGEASACTTLKASVLGSFTRAAARDASSSPMGSFVRGAGNNNSMYTLPSGLVYKGEEDDEVTGSPLQFQLSDPSLGGLNNKTRDTVCQTEQVTTVSKASQSTTGALENVGRTTSKSCQTIPQSTNELKDTDSFMDTLMMRKDFENRTKTIEANAEAKRDELRCQIVDNEDRHEEEMSILHQQITELEDTLTKRDHLMDLERAAFADKKKQLQEEMIKMGEQLQSADSRILELNQQLAQSRRINTLQETIIKKKSENETSNAQVQKGGKSTEARQQHSEMVRHQSYALALKSKSEQEIKELEKNKDQLQRQVQQLQDQREVDELVAGEISTSQSPLIVSARSQPVRGWAPKPPPTGKEKRKAASAAAAVHQGHRAAMAKSKFKSAAQQVQASAAVKSAAQPSHSPGMNSFPPMIVNALANATNTQRAGALGTAVGGPAASSSASASVVAHAGSMSRRPSMGASLLSGADDSNPLMSRSMSRSMSRHPFSGSGRHGSFSRRQSTVSVISHDSGTTDETTSLCDFEEEQQSQQQQWEVYKEAVSHIEPTEIVGALANQQLDTHNTMLQCMEKLVSTAQTFEQKSGVSQLRSVEERIREALAEAKLFYENQIQTFRDETEQREQDINARWQEVLTDAEAELTRKSLQLEEMHDEVVKMRAAAEKAKAEASMTLQEGAKLADTVSELRAALLTVQDHLSEPATVQRDGSVIPPMPAVCAICREETLDKELLLQYTFNKDRHFQLPSQNKSRSSSQRPQSARSQATTKKLIERANGGGDIGSRWKTDPALGILLPDYSVKKQEDRMSDEVGSNIGRSVGNPVVRNLFSSDRDTDYYHHGGSRRQQQQDINNAMPGMVSGRSLKPTKPRPPSAAVSRK